MKRSAWLAVALVLALLPTGCVTRRFLITSDPPGAIVFRDGQPIGATPVEDSFVYYGKYHFRLVKDGYEPLDVDQPVTPPWYEIIGIDFFSETLLPFTLRDKRCFNYTLQPQVQIGHEELRRRAEELRCQGKTIQPPPGVVIPPRHPNVPPPEGAVAPGLPVLPAPVPATPGTGVPGAPLPPPVPGPPPGASAPGAPAPVANAAGSTTPGADTASSSAPVAGITRPVGPTSPSPSP
jgi:hypothetical protein